MWYKLKMTRDRLAPTSNPDVPAPRSRILKDLLKIAVPITLGSSIISIITLIDSQQILSRLQTAAGYSAKEAATLYGVYYKGLTLFNLTAAFINPLTISIIPAIAAAITKKEHKEAAMVSESAMRITTLIALPAGIGMSVLAYPIFNVLYPNSAAQGPQLLIVMGIASFFVCVSLITTAILQAYGYERLSLINMCIGGVLKITLNYFLVGTPSINIHGAPIGNLVCYLAMSLLNIFFIMRKLPQPPRMIKSFARPAIASIIMGIVAYFSYTILSGVMGGADISRLKMVLCLGIAIILACVVYFILIIAIRGITREDALLLPKGEKIAKILKLK